MAAVDLDRGVGGSQCYVHVRMRYPDGAGGFSDTVSMGRYVDEWALRDGEWRVTHRRYLHGLDETAAVTSAGFEPGGTRGPDDPSYRVLRLLAP